MASVGDSAYHELMLPHEAPARKRSPCREADRVPPAGDLARRPRHNLSELRSERRVATTQPSEEADIERRRANPQVKALSIRPLRI